MASIPPIIVGDLKLTKSHKKLLLVLLFLVIALFFEYAVKEA